jgi:uncharacterized membrane protein
MPGIDQLGQLTKTYGLTVGVLLAVILGLVYVVRVLYADNQSLHGKLTQLLDERGKYLDSILSEAINAKTSKRGS